jgi:hypothetical protein
VVKEVTPSLVVSTVSTGLLFPSSLGFDLAGNLFVADDAGVERLVASGNPTVPRSVTIKPGDAKLTVSWSAPASAGTGTITGYVVTASHSGFGTGASCTTTGLTCVLSNVTNSNSYSYFNSFLQDDYSMSVQVEAVTSTAGWSQSAPVVATPEQAAAAPVVVVGSPRASGAQVSWQASGQGGPPSSFTITPYLVGPTLTARPSTTVSATASLPVSIKGLTVGKTYVFTVTARNGSGAGTSEVSNWVKPGLKNPSGTAPGAPTAVRAHYTASTHSWSVAWKAPAKHGSSAIAAYCIQPTENSFSAGPTICVKGSLRTAVVNSYSTATHKYVGLKPGQYIVDAFAISASGNGVLSTTTSFTILNLQ